jgi:shikimate kinase
MEMGKNIVLIGFMGTGKSSVGTRLGQKLHREFLDMDREIEHLLGMPVERIFRVYGEMRFRSEERLLAEKLGKRRNLVIATGGGVVLDPENIQALKQNGLVVCLQAKPEDILERVNRKKGTRPLLKKGSSIEDIQEMLKQREAFYSTADLTIDTSGKELEEIVALIINYTVQAGKREEAGRG